MSNILKEFINIGNNYQVTIQNMTQGNNRANNMSERLGKYNSLACGDRELIENKI